MTKDELNVWLCTVLSTLAETGGSPESTLYCAMDCDINKWQVLRGVMVQAELVKVQNHYVTPTTKGLEMAAKVDALVAASKHP